MDTETYARIQRLSSEWSNAAEMSVYLTDQVTPGDRSAIEAVLTPGSVIAAPARVVDFMNERRLRMDMAGLLKMGRSVG